MAARYRVAFAFTGEEEGELTVAVGEELTVQENTPEGAPDGWVLVQRTREAADGSFENGFVPIDFLEAVDTPAASGAQPTVAPTTAAAAATTTAAAPPPPPPAASYRPPSYATDDVGASRPVAPASGAPAYAAASVTPSQASIASLNDPRVAHLLGRHAASAPLSTGASMPPGGGGFGGGASAYSGLSDSASRAGALDTRGLMARAGVGSGPARGLATSPLSALRAAHGISSALVVRDGDDGDSQRRNFSRQFAEHEDKFQAASSERSRMFHALQASMADLVKRVNTCDTRNADVVQGISELTAIIDEERAKWKGRLAKERRQYEEEQKLLSRPGDLVLKSLMDEVRAAAAMEGSGSAQGDGASGGRDESHGDSKEYEGAGAPAAAMAR